MFLKTPALGLHGLLQLVERHCHRLRQISQSAIRVDKLRPHTAVVAEPVDRRKAEFLQSTRRHVECDSTPIAASIHATITDAQLDYLCDCRHQSATRSETGSNEHRIEVLLKSDDGSMFTESGDLIINCTGPQSRFSQAGIPLFDNLLRNRLVVADETDMGIQVDENFAAIGSDGRASRRLFALGPLLRGSLWETTAVPELRGQAMRVAEALLEREPAEVEKMEVIRYI